MVLFPLLGDKRPNSAKPKAYVLLDILLLKSVQGEQEPRPHFTVAFLAILSRGQGTLGISEM